MIEPILQLQQVSKFFMRTPAVDNVSLSLYQGQILCLLGPSGCGKTTLLRIVAGLERPDAGRVLFEGKDISNTPPHQRDFGLMFQEFALFPHKDVGQNIAFGLEMKQNDKIGERVREMLSLVGLAGFERRDISNLSGGERQRVALGRSLAPHPRLLMLDEPLGALDRALRERLMLEIRQILKQVGLTAIYVTHDQTEAFAVADRVVVMHQGRLEQDSTPEQLYRRPETPFVAGFLGFSNLFEVTYLGDQRIETPWGVWPAASADHRPGERVTALIRPEAASLESVEGAIVLEGKLSHCLFRGRFYQISVNVAGLPLTFELPPVELPAVGEEMRLWINPRQILLLPARPSLTPPVEGGRARGEQ
jgi:ABC-type Fe3+/spermidine/putrescine transport system ATPase subunit